MPNKNGHSRLVDQHNRHLNYLRISVTDRCNLRCIYCQPRGKIKKLRHEEILTYEEILRLAEIAINLGVVKIRLTGGDPLLRKGLCDFLPRLTALPGLEEVSLTTNGVLLKKNLEKIRASGIKRINVSLDTLRRKRYERITGRNAFEKVWKAIGSAERQGFYPIKINVVVIKDLNDDELADFAQLSREYPYHIRFIEYMPVGIPNPENMLHHMPSTAIKAQLSGLGDLTRVSKELYDGPAERFKFKNAPGEIGFISPITHHFCHTCNRLRLTASGSLRPCLLSDHEVDLKGPIRNGATDRELAEIFLHAALSKPNAHYLASQNPVPLCAQMSCIGG